MKTTGSIAASLVVSAILAGCASAPMLEAERAALLQRDRDWSAVASEGRDLELILSFWTEDAIVVPPGSPELRGKAAIREYVRKSLSIPGFHIQWNPTSAVVSPDGRLGYTLGENAVTVPGADGKPMTIRGRGATVWRREAGGDWKCAVDIWNTP